MQNLIKKIAKIPSATAIVLGILSVNCLMASDLPPLVIPAGLGVNIHFSRGNENDLDLIAAAGIKFIRMDLFWSDTEQKKGVYNWAAYDELTANLENRKIRPIYILDFSNPIHEDSVIAKDPISGKDQRDTASPQKPESISAYAKWAAAAAKHFQGRNVIWEIWNEPNLTFWKPKPDAKQYATLALATCRAIRDADPQATIIAPGAGEFPWPFLETLFASGVLKYLDAVSVHPYRNYIDGPETAASDYLKLRGLIQRFAPPSKKSLPILSGEWGYPTHTKGVSLETQAAFIARQQLANLLNGVPVSIWYDWKNDSNDPANNESNFGIVRADLAPKPSYVAVKTLTGQLSGFRVARRLDTPADDDFVLLLVNDDGAQKLAAWTAGKPHPISFEAGVSAADVSAVDGQGRPLAIKNATDYSLEINLQIAPQYIQFKKQVRALAASAAWSLSAPALIKGNHAGGVDVSVVVKNPFPQPLRIKLSLKTPDHPINAKFDAGAGKTATKTLHFATARRSPEQIEAFLKVQLFEKNGALLQENTQALHFVLANSFKLQMVLSEHEMRLLVENPLRCSFTGNAMINGKRLPVKIDAATPEFTVHAPLPANSSTITASLVTGSNDASVSETLTSRFQPLTSVALKTNLEGDAKIPGLVRLIEADAPGGETKPFAKAYQLDYSFGDGSRYARCGTDKPFPIAGEPKALGLWFYGDASAIPLRARLIDGSGQRFHPTARNLDGVDWHWVTFDLSNLSRTYHWGGANDGQVHGELTLDTLLLVEKEDHKKTSGTLYFAGPTLVY